MIGWIQQVLTGINALPVWYVAGFFALSGMLQAVIPVYPGDILLIVGAGIWTGGLANNFFPVLFSYWVGTTAASLGITECGRRFGGKLLSRPLLCRIFPPQRRKHAAAWIRKRGVFTIFAAKFVLGMNLPVLLISGLLEMPRKRLFPAVLVTAAFHNSLFYSLGSVVGLNWRSVNVFLEEYRTVAAIVLALAIAVAFWMRSRVASSNRQDE